MAAITENQMLIWLGIGVANQRQAVRTDLLSDGLGGLEHMTEDDIKDACVGYAKRTDNPFPIMLTLLQKKRLYSLVLWVKDMVRAGIEPEFDNGTTRDEFVSALNEA